MSEEHPERVLVPVAGALYDYVANTAERVLRQIGFEDRMLEVEALLLRAEAKRQNVDPRGVLARTSIGAIWDRAEITSTWGQQKRRLLLQDMYPKKCIDRIGPRKFAHIFDVLPTMLHMNKRSMEHDEREQLTDDLRLVYGWLAGLTIDNLAGTRGIQVTEVGWMRQRIARAMGQTVIYRDLVEAPSIFDIANRDGRCRCTEDAGLRQQFEAF